MENHNLLKLLDGTPGFSSTKLIICEGRSTSTGWRPARSPRSTTGVVSGRQAGPGRRRSLIQSVRTYSVNLAVPHSSPEVWAVRCSRTDCAFRYHTVFNPHIQALNVARISQSVLIRGVMEAYRVYFPPPDSGVSCKEFSSVSWVYDGAYLS